MFALRRARLTMAGVQQLLLMTPAMRLSEGPKIAAELHACSAISKQVHACLEATAELQRLQKRRAELQGLPFQSRWESAAELSSIVLCAVAGGLSASLHFAFLSLFGVAIYVYRRSTAAIRKRQAAQVELAELNARIRAAAEALRDVEERLKTQATSVS